MANKPTLNTGSAQEQLDVAEKQLDAFEQNIKDLTMDRMNEAPKYEQEAQTKIANKELKKDNAEYLKPVNRVGAKEKFNEKFRSAYDFAREYVRVIAENKEIIGETIQLWTKPFPGMSAEEWKVPVNRPVYMPRYLAEQIKRKYYHRLIMQQSTTGSDGHGTYYGTMAADTTIQRLDCVPAAESNTVFMGNGRF